MSSRYLKIILAFFIFTLSGCFDPIEMIFGKREKVNLNPTLDKPAGHYDNIPATIDFTFPTTVDMTTIDDTDFTISDTCAAGVASIGGSSVTGYVLTLTINVAGVCAETEEVTLILDSANIDMTSATSKATGTDTYTYVIDTTPPTLSATINTVSGISTSGSYAFTSKPTSVKYTFSSDIDMASITASDFIINSAGATDCSVMPTIGTLSKNTTQHTVTVPISGGTCGDAESFMISLPSNSVSDSVRDSTSGNPLPWPAPAVDLDIMIEVFTSGVSVIDVGNGGTSADGTYGIGSPVDIVVTFDQSVDVTGTPRLQLNITGGGTRYALYTGGTGTPDLTFSYTVAVSDTAGDLDYASTSALQLNGGTITRSGTNGGIVATRTLPSPGAINSLGFNRNIVIDTNVPTISTSSPTGPTNTWGTELRSITFTFSKTLDPATLDDTDLTITPGTCSGVPTVVGSSVSGGSNNIVNFSLSANTCANGETYTLSMDPTLVSDLSANAGYGSPRTISVTTNTTQPTLSLGAPSKSFVNAAGTVTYTATYSGATSVTLSNGDINFAGASTGCAANVTGSGTTTRTISITGCTDDGAVQIDVAANTAINTYGNYSAAVAEAAITDFNADNTQLPDPTLSLPVYGLNSVYNLDTVANFTLTFAGDDLGSSANLQSTLNLNCDAGGGANIVTFTATRTNATVATIAPNEASPDFVYNSDCTINGTNVPDSAGNVHTFTSALPFKVGKNLQATSGPSGTISIATATSAGDLGSVLFNVSTDPATVIAANVTLTCDSNDITISALTPTANDTDILIDFDESDADWTSLVGGESCTLSFSTSVQNSLGIPLTAPVNFNFTTAP